MERFKTKQQRIEKLEAEIEELETKLEESRNEEEVASEIKSELGDTIPAVIEFLQMISNGGKVNDVASILTKKYDIDRRLEDAMFQFIIPVKPKRSKK